MLHRSTSSRHRRASRSAASSPQTRAPRSEASSPGRRASIAVSPVDQSRTLVPENRSPRHSLVPDISLSRHSLDAESPTRIPRNCVMEVNRSSRNSLVPDNYARSPRNSLIPDTSLSPRSSLIPDAVLSPRNSLVPDAFSRSPRNSLVPDFNKSPRSSLVPDCNRSPRHSLIPDNYNSRNNLTAPDYNRSPRNSLVPETNRSPRHSLVPSDSTIWNQRTNANAEETGTRSPRHTSPRGSIAPEILSARTSPRESITPEYLEDRSPRGSIGPETGHNRSPRGSVGRNVIESSPGRSPRGSLTLTFQEPPASERRYSADNQSGGKSGRSTSPYRMAVRGPQVNFGYSASTWSESGSRRASSSVSQVVVTLPQVSGDDQRRLFSEHTKLSGSSGGASGSLAGVNSSLPLGISLATYGSVAYQLKDANMEASGTCDFVYRALRIVNKTVVVTIVLVCLSTLPMLMLIMGVQFLRDCPREPHIPVYMVVGGSLGCVKMAWLLWGQLGSRRLDDGLMASTSSSSSNSSSAGSRVASLALTVFLIAWFALGNYWILKIKWPDYVPTLYEPNRWCHRTLYVFAFVHLYIVYSVFVAIGLLVVMLAGCQLVGCPWLGTGRYK